MALRQRITTLEYPPGARLDIDCLSEEFAVSRTPVRNVLQRLDSEDLVRTRHGVGTVVAPLDHEEWRQAMVLRIELTSLIGRLGARTIAPETISAIRNGRRAAEGLFGTKDPVLFARVDMQIHAAICDVVGNDMLRRVYDEMYFRTARLRFLYLRDQRWDKEVTIFFREIALLLSAMEKDDAEGVGDVVRRCLLDFIDRIEPRLATAPGRESTDPNLVSA